MEIALLTIFVLGYTAIALEHRLGVNKAATALVTGVMMWTVYILFTGDHDAVSANLSHHVGEIAGILFFLMGAMTIVELIAAYDGFELITKRITTTDKRKLLWLVALLAFFLSAVLDNLTTAIIMITLTRELIPERKDKLLFAGIIIIAANAGGAWSPIGDVTTTMLWIGGQITAWNIIVKLILPSLLCLAVPLIITSRMVKGQAHRPERQNGKHVPATIGEQKLVLYGGIGILIMVPVFKSVTHLPPYMGMLIGLGILWIITEALKDRGDENQRLSVANVLRRIDTPSILFFLGILIAIAALESTHVLEDFAHVLHDKIGNLSAIVMSIGVLSAVLDNVPLTAAAMAMYPLHDFPTDHYLWEFMAYCTGTGGSILVIGSAAGVAAMGMEKIEFGWYLKRVSWLATLGFFAGAGVYILQHYLLQ